jgi:hypothetical protein
MVGDPEVHIVERPPSDEVPENDDLSNFNMNLPKTRAVSTGRCNTG